MMADFRMAYPRETPNPWKGFLVAEESLFPSVDALDNANLADVFSVTDLEIRERRLVVHLEASGALSTSPGKPNFSGCRSGSYFQSNGGSEFGSLARRYNLGLRITCNGYVQTVLQCDARQGVYRIPPSSAVRVQAVLSKVNSLAYDYFPLQLRAELIDSCDGPFLRPTETVAIEFNGTSIGTGQSAQIRLNPLARWINFVGFGEFEMGNLSAPVLTAVPVAGGNLGPAFLRDYANLAWFPSGEPIDLGGGVCIYNDSDAASYNIKNTGVGVAYTQFVQFLEW